MDPKGLKNTINYLVSKIDETMRKCNKCMKCKKHSKGVCKEWNPLLLVIPLRLGLNEFNQDYKESIKVRYSLLISSLKYKL